MTHYAKLDNLSKFCYYSYVCVTNFKFLKNKYGEIGPDINSSHSSLS